MKRLRKNSILILCSIVVAATALGWWVYHRLDHHPPDAVRVLCADDWLDAPTLDDFARARNVRIDLYTYRDVAEFLRQLANADGRIDVICTSSLLLRSLVRSQWIKKVDYPALKNAGRVAADFINLPFDPHFGFGVPIHWTSYGYTGARAIDGTLKQMLTRGRVGVWASPLNYMALMTEAGIQFEERLESEDLKRLQDDVHRFVSGVGTIPTDTTTATAIAATKRFDFAHVPSSLVSPGAGFFGPGDDGGIVDVGVLAVGERAANPELGIALIDRLIETSLEPAVRSGRGAVVSLGEGDPRLKPAQRPSALRAMPLTKMRFPDVNAEATLKFFRLFPSPRAGAR